MRPRPLLAALITAAALVATLPGTATAAPAGPSPGAPGIGDPYFPLAGNGGYDVRSYGLDLRYDPATRRLVGTAAVLATATQALSRFDPATDVEAVFAQAHEAGYGDVLESTAILSALRLPDRPTDAELFVNVSERGMSSPYFWQTMPPRLDGVVVELHETRHGLDEDGVSRLLDRFRDRGARICLDDLVCSAEDLDRVVCLRPSGCCWRSRPRHWWSRVGDGSATSRSTGSPPWSGRSRSRRWLASWCSACTRLRWRPRWPRRCWSSRRSGRSCTGWSSARWLIPRC